MQRPEDVRAAFTEPEEFWSSPLYRTLSAAVAGDPYLVGLAAHTRDGQVPTFAFFGAVHALLLDGAEHPLGAYYPSLRGDAALPPEGAGQHLLAFARHHETAIIGIVSTRFAQTNQVRRAVGLRLGLAAIAPSLSDQPAHLLEVGTSTGLLLRHAHYGYRLGVRQFGDRDPPVQLTTEWRSTQPPPDLDAIPVLASTCGVDLNPLDATVEADRRWLEALIWPEDRDKATLLHDALTLATHEPVQIMAGDAIDLCPVWSTRTPAGEPRIVFHCATRMHVPLDQRADFDRAIDNIGQDGPLYRIIIEGDGIQITEPGQPTSRRFDAEGHLGWAAPADS
ncbi:DUF2332 domain-containing protein [Jatrophihabitans sp. GAS493]|uniref:DUF2332 domain-containing protein n=1 Tax=Jatrophihabitans sp. GAS493 TaxID=1907575 RepID=UPI0012FDE9AA|nr:DUF2332 domain-containing protein [Jatrophihabitans sp. GAS493]